MDNLDKKIGQLTSVVSNIEQSAELAKAIKSLLREVLEGVVPERKDANERMTEFGAHRQALADGYDEAIDEVRSNISRLMEGE